VRFILAIIAAEAITEILIASELLDGPREWLAKKHALLRTFTECGWCISVWVAVVVYAFMVYKLDALLVIPVIHRMSNLLHDLFGVVLKMKWRH